MKRSLSQAFTLIEMLTVMLIIAIIAGLIIQVAGYASKKSALTQAKGEIESMGVAIAAYKQDNGTVPRLPGTTEAETAEQSKDSPIDPKKQGNPISKEYKAANIFLYQQLSGDVDLDGNGGDQANNQSLPMYGSFSPKQLSVKTSTKMVEYVHDPFGNAYGYSTCGALADDDYRSKAKAQKASTKGEGTSPTREDQPGYNNTYDLWSTAGDTTAKPSDVTHNKWIKNW